ncbi:T9SS type A sorting domain-containing protein [bacterium]|nr:T9SS type A sorting domain-containing protein [bacterium]
MKPGKLIILIFAGVIFFSPALNGQLLVENFDYPAASLLHDNGWTVITSGEPHITIIPTVAEYAGYPLSGIGNQASLLPDGEEVMRSFAAQNSGAVYVSFLINVSSASTIASGNNVLYLGPAGTSLLNKYWSANIRTNSSGELSFGVGQLGSVSYTSYQYLLYTTYLIVIAYEFVDGESNDIVRLWVNPPLDGSVPSPDEWHTVSYETSSLQEIVITQYESEPACILDGIQITTAWPFVNTAVPEAAVREPRTPALAPNYPNPFNPETTISFEVFRDDRVTLSVLDLRGRIVRTLTNRRYSPGIYQLSWDGKDEAGKSAASGQYLFRLTQGTDVLVRKGVLVR